VAVPTGAYVPIPVIVKLQQGRETRQRMGWDNLAEISSKAPSQGMHLWMVK